jgi:hypothetical protein
MRGKLPHAAIKLIDPVDAFSYLSVLLSIILGLGLTQLLTAVGRLIRHRDRVRLDWLPLLWAAVLLVVYVQAWWAMFGLRNVREWTFVAFLAVLAQTCTLYMMAAVVLPEQVDDAGVDLAAHYERQRRWFFGFFLATLVVSIAKDLVIGRRLPSPVNLAFHGVLGALCVSAMTVGRRRVHEAIGIAGAAAIAMYISLLFMRLR